jgi:predicted dehydrogenase
MLRRRFLESTTATLVAAPCLDAAAAASQDPSTEARPLVVGIMGFSRGRDLAEELLKIPGVSIKTICETDTQRGESGVQRIAEAGGKANTVTDLRRMLDDPQIDAFFCAAPNHWHGPAAILGCKAGKHVYVEKPACHNPQEGEWMVQAANQYQRCVQVGNQRRSSVGFRNAIAKLHAGAIGKVYLARAFFNRLRGPIGVKPDSAPPPQLDYEMWQGPAPRRPFRQNVVHYNWHWFWHWGNGELGNNGVHALDICRWGLQADYPIRTHSMGGRFRYVDDQETPDTQTVSWEFEGGRQITYEGLSCVKHNNGPFVSFYGYDGYMEIDADGGYEIFDANEKSVESAPKTGWGQSEHVANFIDAVRHNDPSRLNQPIQSGHQSTLLCHLGNIAYRTDRVIHTRSTDGHILDTDIPPGLWRREYDPNWENLISTL